MTTQTPKPRNPQEALREPTSIPANRSREAQALIEIAAAGRFALQLCSQCNRTHYPPQQFCSNCLSPTLEWRDVSNLGTLLAETTQHHANELYFRARLPWRIGLVELDLGPRIIAHLAADCSRGQRVQLAIITDRAGNPIVHASADPANLDSANDAQTRELKVDPRGRRILLVDGKTPLGAALAQSFLDSGARAVYAGYAQAWRQTPSLERLATQKQVQLFPLDVTDTDSVKEIGALLGGKVDILVNNAISRPQRGRIRAHGPQRNTR